MANIITAIRIVCSISCSLLCRYPLLRTVSSRRAVYLRFVQVCGAAAAGPAATVVRVRREQIVRVVEDVVFAACGLHWKSAL